jgi:hypothetical protein
MSIHLELCAVSKIMYLREGEVVPGEEAKIARFEKKMADWQRDVVDKNLLVKTEPVKEEISNAMFRLERSFGGYWCEGEECVCPQTHWVFNESAGNCYKCNHDPCACNPPLVWDEEESAYYSFFLSSDGAVQTNTWMSEPKSDVQKMGYFRATRKRKAREEEDREIAVCGELHEQANIELYCCPGHARKAKLNAKLKEEKKTRDGVNEGTMEGPGFCKHCIDDPCVFIQFEDTIVKNDLIYFDAKEYAEDPVTVNRQRHKRAYQFTAHLLWEGIKYRRQHYTCVEAGVRALFPPFDGKVMGFKEA